MNQDDSLPNSNYIDTSIGLKYLNNNKALYLKILNRFVTRYSNFDIHQIKEEDFKNEMHTLKGLSSTLGMEQLSTLAKQLHEERNEALLSDFTKMLNTIIADLNSPHHATS